MTSQRCRWVHQALPEYLRVKKNSFSRGLQWQPLSQPSPLQLRASLWLCKAVAACSGHLAATPGGKEAFLFFFKGERTQRENDECQSFLSCLFFLSLQKHLMALTLFLQDVAAGRDSLDRYYIVMTWLIWERVDLGSAWETKCGSFVWVNSEYTVQYRNLIDIHFKLYEKLHVLYNSLYTLPLQWTKYLSAWDCKILL